MSTTTNGQRGLWASLRRVFARREVTAEGVSTEALAARLDHVRSEPVREAPPRAFADWNPNLFRAALRMADSGSLRLAADLCEELFADDRVQGVLGVRVRGLLRLPVRFELDGDADEKTPEEEALEEDFWKAYPEADLVQLCSWGLLLGVGLGQQVWEERNGRLIPRLQVWHPRALRWDWQSREWRLSVDGGAEIVITPGDGTWVLYTPYGENRPWARAIWKPAGLALLAKRYAIEDFNRHAEAHGSPVKVGTAPDGASAQARRSFAEDLSALMKDASVVLPPGYDVKYVEATARTWEVFTSLIGWADKALSICIAGQNLTSDIEGGSFAAAQVHATIARHLIESDEQTLSTTLYEQGLRWWAEFNYGAPDRAPWVRWDTTPPEDLQPKANAISTIATAVSSLNAAGFAIDTAELARRFDIPLLADNEEAAIKAARAAKLVENLPAYLPNGVVTINEARGLFGLPPVPGGHEIAKPSLGFGAFKARPPRTALRASASGTESDGQVYTDELVNEATQAAAEVLQRDIDRVREAIDAATDPEDLERRLNELYADMDPTEFAELTAKAFLLAELAGRFEAINEVIES